MWSFAILPSLGYGKACVKIVYLFLPVAAIMAFLFGTTNGVPCFCTENRCTYGYCESAWCLVGIKHNGRVIRTCGGQPSQQLQPCRQDVGDWQDVCSCTTPYCNTFAFLRYEIRWVPSAVNRADGARVHPPQVDHHDLHHSDENQEHGVVGNSRKGRKKVNADTGDVTFERNDGKDLGSIKQSHLVVVLIVVPLAVAGTAVIVVVIGYYCKMC